MSNAVGDADDEQRIARWEQRTDRPLTVVAVAYLAAYATQVLASRRGQLLWTVLEVVLWAIWAVFVVDFLGRLALARHRGRFLLGHPLDVLVVLAPFFRFLRLLRLVTVVSSLARALRDDLRGRVGAYLVVSASLVSFVAALAVLEAERDAPDASITTFGDAVWWVLTTITTVGYGDRYPVTVEGRLVAAGLMLGGIAILGTVTAAIASWFLEQIGADDRSRRAERGDAASPDAALTAELLAEVRALHERLDRLERGGAAPDVPAAGVRPPAGG